MLDESKKQTQPLIIKADRFASYDVVITVTNIALEHGITNVSLATGAMK